MTYDAMKVLAEKRAEASLAKLMHEAHSPKKPKRHTFGNPSNRKGKQLPHITKRISRVKRFKGDFSVRDVADKLSISKGGAAWVVEVMLEKNQIHRVPQLGGESEFRYKIAAH